MPRPNEVRSYDASREVAARQLEAALAPQRYAIETHGVYDVIDGIADLRVFMEHHVFAVWDFMALLKAMQRHLTCTELYWRPIGDAASRRLINEMVLEEESDEINGVPTSHFDVYLDAMREVGADTGPITAFLGHLENHADLETGFSHSRAPVAARDFVRSTFDVIATGKPHMVCAAFTCGREQAIPAIFKAVLEALSRSGDETPTLGLYLQRHIELDGDDHGPKATAMLSALCGDSALRWQEAESAARQALLARVALWSGIAAEIAVHRARLPTRIGGTFPHCGVAAQGGRAHQTAMA